MPAIQATAGYLSAHARYAAAAAGALGYEFRTLDGADGYLFEVRDGARSAVFAAGANTPYALNDARGAAIARDKAFTARVLEHAGVPVIPGRMFFVTDRWSQMRSPGREPEDALNYARTLQYPVFCKPIAGSNGLYAEVVADNEAFADYMRRVSREHFAILIQPYIRAREYRVFVLDGRALFSYRKRPPEIVGDGKSTLAELVERISRDDGSPSLRPRARDSLGNIVGADAVVAANNPVMLEGPANRAAGGASADLRDGAPPALETTALAAAKALGLRLAGVDIFEGAAAGELAVIEVNSNPMIATLEDHGRWDLIVEIWRANLDAALR